MVYVHERLSDVVLTLGMDECHERMGCPIGVPEGECGIGFAIRMVHFVVCSAIVAIDITEHTGCDHRMVKGGIKDAASLSVTSVDLYLRELVLPLLTGIGENPHEVPRRDFGFEVHLGIVLAHCRESHLHQ